MWLAYLKIWLLIWLTPAWMPFMATDARVSQVVIEEVGAPTNAQVNLSQEVIEVVGAPTNAQVNISQVVVEKITQFSTAVSLSQLVVEAIVPLSTYVPLSPELWPAIEQLGHSFRVDAQKKDVRATQPNDGWWKETLTSSGSPRVSQIITQVVFQPTDESARASQKLVQVVHQPTDELTQVSQLIATAVFQPTDEHIRASQIQAQAVFVPPPPPPGTNPNSFCVIFKLPWFSNCPPLPIVVPGGSIGSQGGVPREARQPEWPELDPSLMADLFPTMGLPRLGEARTQPGMPGGQYVGNPSWGGGMSRQGPDTNLVGGQVDPDVFNRVLKYVRENREAFAQTYDELAKRINELTESTFIALSWSQDPAGGNPVDFPASRLDNGRVGSTGTIMVTYGAAVSVVATVSPALLTGTLTVVVTKNGVQEPLLSVTLDASDPAIATSNKTRIDPWILTFQYGDLIHAVLTASNVTTGIPPADPDVFQLEVSIELVNV